jgi:Plavaka transposase
MICDEHGNNIPLNTPLPPHPSDCGPDNWTPYNNQVQFEVADFLYCHNQMSGGDINFVLNLWAASLAAHDDTPPFTSCADMYETIDSTSIGNIPWKSAALQYDGIQPDDAVPSWMTTKYDVWFQNARLLVHNIIANPDFKSSEIDYAPLQEYSGEGIHRFHNFMSGDWCWKQAVSQLVYNVFFAFNLKFFLHRT